MADANHCACIFSDSSAFEQVNYAGQPSSVSSRGISVPVLKCKSCGHLFFPPPPQEELDHYYNTDYPESSKSWYNYANDTEPYKVSTKADAVVDVIARAGLGGEEVTLHEFGCAFGGTVRELARRGYNISGSELNAAAVKEARDNGNDRIFNKGIADVLTTPATVIYSFHVLEHLSQPVEFLKSLQKLLTPNGVVALFLPNGFALEALAKRIEDYPWVFFPGHLNLWTSSSISCLARQTGYEVIDVFSREFKCT